MVNMNSAIHKVTYLSVNLSIQKNITNLEILDSSIGDTKTHTYLKNNLNTIPASALTFNLIK